MVAWANHESMQTQWVALLKQLRPNIAADDLSSLIPWGYNFVTSVQNGQIVGIGAYIKTSSLALGDYHYLSDLVVDAGSRGKGVGSFLINQILDMEIPCALDSGFEKTSAHQFYLRHGFTVAGYTVRLQSSAFVTIGNYQQERVALIANANNLSVLKERERHSIQLFLDNVIGHKSPHQASLQAFMNANPNQYLLVLKDISGGVEGVLLFELQNRLYIGGPCFHVSDLLVKTDEKSMERQSCLLLALVVISKKYNDNKIAPVKSVIVEMTEEEVKFHSIPICDKVGGYPKAGQNSTVSPLAVRSLFCTTAKHFIRNDFTVPDLAY